MKTRTTHRSSITSVTLLVTAVLTLTVAHRPLAQGPLNPPGAPAPTMKTLTQVEPRIPISSLPVTINQPGSYYLTGNLTGVSGQNGITITANGVTLDLMGFELVGVPGSDDGVGVSQNRFGIVVRNGTVRNWGADGVDGFDSRDSRYRDLRLRSNGNHGLTFGEHSEVTDCLASFNGGTGIHSVNAGNIVSHCTASDNTLSGIYADDGSIVKHCTAYSNTESGIRVDRESEVSQCVAHSNVGIGIEASLGNTIRDCSVSRNGDDGINAGSGSSVIDCSAYANTGDGIEVISGCSVRNNNCRSNGFNGTAAGIHVTGNQNRIESNNVTFNDRGLDVDNDGNIIIRNSARANSANYAHVVAGNTVGEVITTTAAGGTLDETHSAWANFSF